jgi:hypothetical protein
MVENSERGGLTRRRLMVWGLGVGVPLNLLTTLAGRDWFAVDRYVCAPLVAFGRLGGITRWCTGCVASRGGFGGVSARSGGRR